MFTFILRRILYSIPVLFASSFLIFICVSAVGNPLSELRLNPLISQQTLQNISERKHLEDPIPVRYVYWLKDAVSTSSGLRSSFRRRSGTISRALSHTPCSS